MSVPPPLIAHVLHRLDYGGLENGLINLINGLPVTAYRHAIVCLTGAGDFQHRLQRPEVPVYTLNKNPGQDPVAYLRLFRLLRQLAPTAVHTRNTGTLDCQILARLAGVPHRIHGYHGFDTNDLTGTRVWPNLVRRSCDPFVQHYVAVSGQIATWLAQTLGVRPARIAQICNGVDTHRFQPGQAWASGAPLTRAAPRVIGTVGRFQTVKNQQLLVQACGLIRRTAPDLLGTWALRLVGDGPDRALLEAAIKTEGLESLATLTGWDNDVPAALAGLSVFVLPSLNEGLSNTLLEAMACGLPAIATAVGGNPELVVEGETGFLIPSNAPAVLAERLLRYLRLPALAQTHGRAARARVEENFGIQRMLLDYHRLYQKVLFGSQCADSLSSG